MVFVVCVGNLYFISSQASQNDQGAKAAFKPNELIQDSPHPTNVRVYQQSAGVSNATPQVKPKWKTFVKSTTKHFNSSLRKKLRYHWL